MIGRTERTAGTYNERGKGFGCEKLARVVAEGGDDGRGGPHRGDGGGKREVVVMFCIEDWEVSRFV